MNRYRLLHVTEFQYDGPVSESYNQVWLRPRQDDRQSCLSFRLTTDPHSRVSSYVDPMGNYVHRFNIIPEHRRLRVEAESVVLVQEPIPMPLSSVRLDALEEHADALEEHYDLMSPTTYVPHVPSLMELVQAAEAHCDGTTANFAQIASSLIHERFRYEKGATHVQSSIEDPLSTGAGVCQDFAHLLLAVLRMRGLPGRYVSGYLAPTRTGEYASGMEEVIGGMASHAWSEVFIPEAGWFGLDPTSGRDVDMRHVRVAYGRDYGDVAPVRGVYKGHAGQRLSVDVRVRPALDDEGFEHLKETAAEPARVPSPQDLPQQQPQQQQQ
jgi:transglutaminase-like putative cysteine protease